MLLSLLATLSIAAAPMVRVSVEGNGFLQFAQDGHALYTSSAPLIVADGWLSYPNGAPLLPTLRVPDGTQRVDIDEDGNVFAVTSGFRGRVGRISLATFSSDADLRPYGSFLVSSAQPRYEAPGKGDAGTIHVLTPTEATPPNTTEGTEPLEDISVSRDDDFVQEWINRRPDFLKPVGTVRSGEAHIVFSSESDINADRYTLGDLAVVDADSGLRDALISAHIGDTPKAGDKVGIRRDAILRELQSQGFDTSDFKIDIPRRAFVTRRGQRASSDQITAIALAAAKRVCANGDLKASLRMDTAYAPDGPLAYEVESCTPTKSGAIVIVVTKVDGQRYNSHVVRISAS